MSEENAPVPKPKSVKKPDSNNSEQTWAIFAHLTGLACYIGIPFGNILGPLVIWLIKKNEMPLVDREGKEALNFQITITLISIVCFALTFVFIGIFLIVPLIITHVILVIVASIKVSNGEVYQYPFNLRLIK